MINWNPIPDFTNQGVQIHTITGATTVLGTHLFSPSWVHILIAVSVVTSAKEIWAYFNPSKYQVSLGDTVATLLGSLAAFGAVKFLF
jgi:hypothetical protein